MKMCIKDMLQIGNKDMQQICNSYAIQICKTYAIQICNTDMQQICNEDMQHICNKYATDMQHKLKISCSTQHLPIQDGRAVLPNIYPYIDPLFAVGDLCRDNFGVLSEE